MLSVWGKGDVNKGFRLGNPREGDNLEELGVRERILEWIFKKSFGRDWTGLYGSGLREMVESCECGKEYSGSGKFGKFGKIPCACWESNQNVSVVQPVAVTIPGGLFRTAANKHNLILYSQHAPSKPGMHKSRAPNICGSSVWILLHVTLVPRRFR
jgi:hypothetical protein